jgi:hypothetical protein
VNPAPPPTAPPGRPQVSPKRYFWTRGWGLGLILFGAGLVVLIPLTLVYAVRSGPAAGAKDITVRVSSCSMDSAGNATVGVMVGNIGARTISARLGIEYRDSAGARLDTDTLYVRNIAPGDTARSEEITNLDASTGVGDITDPTGREHYLRITAEEWRPMPRPPGMPRV